MEPFVSHFENRLKLPLTVGQFKPL